MRTALTMTARGVVTLPARLRREMGLKANDQLIAETTPDGVLLRPAVTVPVEVYGPAREQEFDEAEAELAKVLKRKRGGRRAASKTGAATRRKSARSR